MSLGEGGELHVGQMQRPPSKSYCVFSHPDRAALTCSSQLAFQISCPRWHHAEQVPLLCLHQPLLFAKIVALSAVGLFICMFTHPVPSSCRKSKDLIS